MCFTNTQCLSCLWFGCFLFQYWKCDVVFVRCCYCENSWIYEWSKLPLIVPNVYREVRTSDPLRTEWGLDVEQLLHSQRVGLLIAHHGNIVQTVKVGQSLSRVHRRGSDAYQVNFHKQMAQEAKNIHENCLNKKGVMCLFCYLQ